MYKELKINETTKYDISITDLKQIFLAFFAANFAIMSTTLIFRKSACSIDKRVRLFKQSWLIDVRYSFFMRFSFEKDRSPLQLVTIMES